MDDEDTAASDQMSPPYQNQMLYSRRNRIQALLNNKDQVIKTLQKNSYMKMKRWGLATPRLCCQWSISKRYILGTGVTYSLTEIFGVEGDINFSPDLGEADWKPLTEHNQELGNISKIQTWKLLFYFHPSMEKQLLLDEIILFDIYDNWLWCHSTRWPKATQTEEDQATIVTQVGLHPTTNYGGEPDYLQRQCCCSSWNFLDAIHWNNQLHHLGDEEQPHHSFSGSIFFPIIQ